MSIFYLFDSIWFYLYLLSIAFYRVWYNDTHWLTYQFAKREMMWDALDLDTLRSRQLWAGPPQLCDGFRSPRAAPLRAQGSCQDTKLIKTPWGRWKVLKMHENDWICTSTLGNKELLDTFRSNKKCVRHSHCSKSRSLDRPLWRSPRPGNAALAQRHTLGIGKEGPNSSHWCTPSSADTRSLTSKF